MPAITAGTGTATINIPDHDILVDLCANSTNCEVSLVVEVNTGTPDAVSECVGDNNDHTFNLPMEIPDLVVSMDSTHRSSVMTIRFRATVLSVWPVM